MTDQTLQLTHSTTEQRIIQAIITDRGVYDTLKRCGDIDGFSPIGRHIAEIVGGYYDTDSSARCCDSGVVIDRAGRLSNPKHSSAVVAFVNDLPKEVSTANVAKDIIEHRRGVIGDKLSLALANRSPEAEKLLEEYQRIGSSDASDHSGPALIDVLDTGDLFTETSDGTELIKLWPKALNENCDGGARRGHQLLIFGRPESGKTLVAINLVAGFLHQKLSVLYVANEEPAADIRLRMRQRLLKLTKEEARSDPQRVAEAIAKADLGRLHIAALSPGSIPEISRLLDRLAYDVLVIDQLRNIKVSAGTRTEELEQAATQARNLAKWHSVLVLAITQAGESASGKTVLELSDVDGSKTGIPAQADLMIGVGNTKQLWDAGMLSISLPKNKLGGNHNSFTVNVNKQTGAIQ